MYDWWSQNLEDRRFDEDVTFVSNLKENYRVSDIMVIWLVCPKFISI